MRKTEPSFRKQSKSSGSLFSWLFFIAIPFWPIPSLAITISNLSHYLPSPEFPESHPAALGFPAAATGGKKGQAHPTPSITLQDLQYHWPCPKDVGSTAGTSGTHTDILISQYLPSSKLAL